MGDFLDKTGLTRVKAKIDSALAAKLNVSLKGVANGVAELNENGHVPSSQLPYAFSNNNPTLAWNTTSTIGTVGGVDLTVKMPANPNTNTTYSFVDKNATLAWGTTHTIATVGGVNIRLTMPANPNTNTTYAFTNKGVTLAWNTTHTIATVGGVNITLKMPANPVSIVNNLTSTVTTSALSAAQGKVLNGKFAATEDAWTGQGIFKNAIAILSKRYTSLGMAFIMGNVNVGRVQSSSGYPAGTQYTVAYCASLKNSDVYGLGAFAANGDADVKVMFDHGYIKFATINNSFPDIIWFSGCIPV